MLSKSVVSLAFAASLMAAPAAFAAATAAPIDMPSAPTGAPADQAAAPGAPRTDPVTNGPQADQGDHARNWSAARNVRESRWYDHLVATNRAFRLARERKECGPINDAQLHASCVASFESGAEAPMYGSSTPPHPIRNSSGASE